MTIKSDLRPSDSQEGDASLLDFGFRDFWVSRLRIAQQYLCCTKALTLDFRFRTMHELLLGSGVVRGLLWRYVRPEWLLQPGALPKMLLKLRGDTYDQIERVRTAVREHDKIVENRETEKREEEARQMATGNETMLKKQKEREKLLLLKKLQGMGMAVSGAGPVVDEEEDKSRVGALRKLKAEKAQTQRALLQLYQRLSNVVIGPHSVHVTSGRYRLMLYMEGVELFDVFLPILEDK